MQQLTMLVPLPYIWPGYAPIALVSALGYDRAEGISLQNIAVGSPTEALAGVARGSGDMTFVNTAFGFVARDRGEPFRMFYAFARRMNRSFAVLAESPIRRVADLKGMRIALHFADLLYFARAALIDEGLDPERDVSFVEWRGPLDEAEEMMKAMRAGEIQAIWQLDLVYGLFAAAGAPLRRLPAHTLDRLTPAASIYAHDRTVAERTALLGTPVFPDRAVSGRGRRTAQTRSVVSCPHVIPTRTWPAAPETPAGTAQPPCGIETRAQDRRRSERQSRRPWPFSCARLRPIDRKRDAGTR